MASRAELEAQAAAQASVVTAAWAQMQAGWATLGLTTASVQTDAGVRAVQELLGDLIAAWGEVSSTIAADFYDDLRAQAGLPGSFAALVLDPLNVAQVDRLVAQALDPTAQAVAQSTGLGEDDFEFVIPEELDLERMLQRLEGPTQRLIRQAERTTIEESSVADPAPGRVRVARVPMGTTTCAFCLIVASRGYVYRSVENAGGGSPENRFHDFCDCEQDISWEPNPQPPEGYDPGDLYGRYEQAAKAAGTTDLRKVLAELRRQEGIR